MTTTQSFRIYEILQRHFKNSDDAKVVVQEVEQVIEAKIDNKLNVLATKGDISLLKDNISSLKEGILNLRIDIEKRFYNNFMGCRNRNRSYRHNIFNHQLFIIK